jgi:ADP-heptose:LPS heptosyltransferase
LGTRSKANALAALGRIQEARQIYAHIVMMEPESTEARTKLRALESLPDDVGGLNNRMPPAENRRHFLVGIGGGIGDMLHATPSIRNIAERTGRRVDVVVFADNPGAEFLVRNNQYVDDVFLMCPRVFERFYETVFLSHSFGPLRFPFNAERILASEDWRSFRPGALPETIFNLEAVRALLGIAFEEQDAGGYFVADVERLTPKEALVGFHAGSKTGRWLSKRWPHFSELGQRLIAQNIRVASFGTRDEYVPGTENRTGGSIEEMCRAMLDCTHFVSNDSGAMHIASALGIPVLALFAPTDPHTHLPIRSTAVAFAIQEPCAPCEVKNHRYFASGACRCVTEIGVDAVEQKVVAMLTMESGSGMEHPTLAAASPAEGGS